MRLTAFPPRSRIMHRREAAAGKARCRALSVCCLLLAMLFYAASPLQTLWQAADGISTHDPVMLRAALDWTSVRDGLKEDIGATPSLALASAGAAQAEDELPAFGESFATTVASHVIDTDMTPDTVIGMLSSASAASTTGWRDGLSRIVRLTFCGPTRFDAAIRMKADDAAPLLVSLRLRGWQWRITRIHLPADLAVPTPRTDRT